MIENNSPLEHLVAFAIAFTMGMMTTMAIATYGARRERQGAVTAKSEAT